MEILQAFYPILTHHWPLNSTIHQDTCGRKHYTLLSLPSTTIATITLAFSFWIFQNSKKHVLHPVIGHTEGKVRAVAEEEESGAGPHSQRSITALVRVSNFFSKCYCSHGLQIGRPYVLLILIDTKTNMTFLIYKASVLTDLLTFTRGQNQGPRKANLAKSVKIIKGSHLFARTLPLHSFLQVSSKIQLQCAFAFKLQGILSAQWGPTFLCDREIKSGDFQIS